MISHRLAFAIALPSFALLTSEAATESLEKVNISLQPAYHAIPVYAAKQYGWFEELGLDVTISTYASGAPQVKDAVENQAWDIGIAGSVPNVIAGSQGISTIGISNDESATTEVVGAPGVTEWPPTNLTQHIFAATPKSTGELLLRKCLVAAGLNFDDDHILFAQQGEVMEELVAEVDPDYACLWAPNTYTYREANPTAEVFCSGKDVDFPIFGGIMVRDDWAAANQDTVKKVLAAYLRGVTFMQNAEELEAVLEISAEWHEYSGTPLSVHALEEDLILRPLFNLDAQLDHLNRNFANDYKSTADQHYIELEEFLFQHGVIENKFEPREYVTDEWMKMVSADATLRGYSYLGTGVGGAAWLESATARSATVSPSTSGGLSGGAVAGIVIGCLAGVLLIGGVAYAYKRNTGIELHS